jgi:hypothetical protein
MLFLFAIEGHMIEDMLKWKGNYEMLEKNQNYIQWYISLNIPFY